VILQILETKRGEQPEPPQSAVPANPSKGRVTIDFLGTPPTPPAQT
jgi:hypothetical protein